MSEHSPVYWCAECHIHTDTPTWLDLVDYPTPLCPICGGLLTHVPTPRRPIRRSATRFLRRQPNV